MGWPPSQDVLVIGFFLVLPFVWPLSLISKSVMRLRVTVLALGTSVWFVVLALAIAIGLDLLVSTGFPITLLTCWLSAWLAPKPWNKLATETDYIPARERRARIRRNFEGWVEETDERVGGLPDWQRRRLLSSSWDHQPELDGRSGDVKERPPHEAWFRSVTAPGPGDSRRRQLLKARARNLYRRHKNENLIDNGPTTRFHLGKLMPFIATVSEAGASLFYRMNNGTVLEESLPKCAAVLDWYADGWPSEGSKQARHTTEWIEAQIARSQEGRPHFDGVLWTQDWWQELEAIIQEVTDLEDCPVPPSSPTIVAWMERRDALRPEWNLSSVDR